MASRFVAYEVHAVKHQLDESVIVTDDRADHWSIYGKWKRNDGVTEYVCIGDFSSRSAAEMAVEMIGPPLAD